MQSLLPNVDLTKYKKSVINSEDIRFITKFDNLKCMYESFQELSAEVKVAKKNEELRERKSIVKLSKEKRLSNANKMIAEAAQILRSDVPVLIFDMEAYEYKQSKITEVGFLSVKNGKIGEFQHLIIEENLNYRNKNYISDEKDNFNFGRSKVVTMKDAVKILASQIDKHDVLLGQSIQSDFNYFGKMTRGYGDIFEGKKVLDTSNMSTVISEDNSIMSIQRGLEFLEIEHKNLHNAGNDVFYTLKYAKGIIEHAEKKIFLTQKANLQQAQSSKLTKKL